MDGGTLVTLEEYRTTCGRRNGSAYALASHFASPYRTKGQPGREGPSRIKAILETWLKNKVLDIDERQG